MLPGKRPSSSNDDRERYWHEGTTPANSPRKCRCIQRKDSLLIAEKYEALNTDSKSSLQTRIQSFGKRDFQKEVIQALKKIPDENSPNNYHSPQRLDLRHGVPKITETTNFQSPIRVCLESNENCSLESNSHNISENLSEIEYETDSSFNDRLSIMATCPSERSNYDSMSDFENSFSDDENCKIIQSMSLDDRKSASQLYLTSTFNEFKRRKSASFEDLQNIPSNYPDFELTL